MPKSKLLFLMLFFVALLALAGGWLTLRLAFPPFIPPPLPQPNGYDDLLRAAEMLAPSTGFYDEMEPEELAAIAEQNEPALALACEALVKECGVPMDWASNPAAGGDLAITGRVTSMRALCRAFSADMREKLTNHQIKEAVASGLAIFQLGKRCYHAGLIVDYLVGLAVQGVAINELRQIVAQDQTARAEILQRLVPLLETGESAEEVIQRELGYVKSASRGYIGWIVRLNLDKMMGAPVEFVRREELWSTARQRLFVIHLALHAYRDEHGDWPNTLAELAPEILASVPADPYGKVPFVYRVETMPTGSTVLVETARTTAEMVTTQD